MVVAIIGILAAVSFMGVLAMQRKMSQTQADKNAEIIFEAAQRELVSVMAFDEEMSTELHKNYGSGLNPIKCNQPVGLEEDTFNMFFALPDGSRDGVQTVLQDSVSDDLYNDGWVVEYDYTSLQVKSVFYFEKGDLETFNSFYEVSTSNAYLRGSKNNRLEYRKATGVTVGYFDGNTSSLDENELKVKATLSIKNYEELVADVGIITTGKNAKDFDYEITVKTKGKKSGVITTQVFTFGGSNLQNVDTKNKKATISLVLDSFNTNAANTGRTGMRFKDTYGAMDETNGERFLKLTDNNTGNVRINGIVLKEDIDVSVEPAVLSGSKDYIPGENLEFDVSVKAKTSGDVTVASDTYNGLDKSVNSLYGLMETEGNDYIATINYGRHLQNLDESTSGFKLSNLTSNSHAVLKAKQGKNIYFNRDENIPGDSDQRVNAQWWKYVYGDKKLLPITNDDLESYTGSVTDDEGNKTYYVINGAVIDTSKKSFAGLFAEFKGDELSDITIVNEQIVGSNKTYNDGGIGGLAGKIAKKENSNVSDNVTIKDCHVYMDVSDTALGSNLKLDDVKNKWMYHATNIGGLVGYANRKLTIADSSASTVIFDALNAGGLIGVSEKTLVLQKSYADCYMAGTVSTGSVASNRKIGGLVASCPSDSNIDTCYSAGFMIAPEASAKYSSSDVAGIAPCEVSSIKDTYTVFRLGSDSDYDANSSFYPTVKAAPGNTNVYYISPDFMVPQSNIIGKDLTSSEMKIAEKAVFSNGTFAYVKQTSFERSTTPYKLVNYTPELGDYRYPMILTDDGKTMNHYGDWFDNSRALNVNFYYSAKALEQKNNNILTLPDSLHTEGGKVLFEENSGVAQAKQQIGEYGSAHLPEQNYELAGREKTVLYWQFTCGGENYFYVPDSKDNYNSAGKKYQGKIYKVSEADWNTWEDNPSNAGIAPWEHFADKVVDETVLLNPFEVVTANIDAYARFYVSDSIQFIRLYYRIFEDSNRELVDGKYIGRYVGRAVVKKTVVGGVVTYSTETEAHIKMAGYQFLGWSITEDGKGDNVFLPYPVISETTQKLTITEAALTSGNLYAIYEKIGNYYVNVEYCFYDDSNNNQGWGSNIYQPEYGIYSTNGNNGMKKVSIPKAEDVPGYVLHDKSTKVYKALFFDEDGNRSTSEDVEIQCPEGTTVEQAFIDGTAFININTARPGTYVVPFDSEQGVNYQIQKIYMDTADASYGYSLGSTHSSAVVSKNGVLGSNIPEEYLEPEHEGFVLDHFESAHTSVIGQPTGSEPYKCIAYYKRIKYEVFYDLAGGTYTYTDANSVVHRQGYHEYETISYGQPLNSVPFVAETLSAANPLTQDGLAFDGWSYYTYSDSAAYNGTTMPNQKIKAVAKWKVTAATKVRLEIYRENRSDAITYDGTSGTWSVLNTNKTYLLQRATDVSNQVDENGKNSIFALSQSTEFKHGELKSLMDGYSSAINGADSEMSRLLTGKETQYYFDGITADTTPLQWNAIKPVLKDGVLVVRLYYNRRIITTTMNYGERFYGDGWSNQQSYNAACADIDLAIARSASDPRISGEVTSFASYAGQGYYRTATITMKALYGADFDDNLYVWTDEIFFQQGSANMGKRHLSCFVDEDGSIGDSMTSNANDIDGKKNWLFSYMQYNGTGYHYDVCFETTDGTGTAITVGGETHYFDTTNVKRYDTGGNSNKFLPGAYRGFELWAANRNGNTFTAKDNQDIPMNEGMTTYNMTFYFIRKTDKNIIFDDMTNVANANAYQKLAYGKTIDLPAASDVTRKNDNDKYTFGGWYKSSIFTDENRLPVSATDPNRQCIEIDNHDMHVYAYWIPNPITITYNPSYPDGDTAYPAGASFAQNDKKFAEAAGDLLALTSAHANNNKLTVENGVTTYKFTDSEGHENTFRFDGWWRKDYTVQLTENEVLYNNTEVYAKWTQVTGYAYLTYRCIKVNDTAEDHQHVVKDTTQKIELGKEIYVYAPLVSGWTEGDWSGYYPTRTRIKETFVGDEPEVVFYYSKGTALSYDVTYKVRFKPYGETTGEDKTITLKKQDYTVAASTTDVDAPNINGYVLSNDSQQTVNVDKDYMLSHEEEGVVFIYEPNISTIKLETKVVIGSEESFPEIQMTEVASLFENTTYNGTLESENYKLVPMYQIYDSAGVPVTDDFVTEEDMKTLVSTLQDGTYSAHGQVRLQKDGTDLLTIWQSSSRVSFMMKSKN